MSKSLVLHYSSKRHLEYRDMNGAVAVGVRCFKTKPTHRIPEYHLSGLSYFPVSTCVKETMATLGQLKAFGIPCSPNKIGKSVSAWFALTAPPRSLEYYLVRAKIKVVGDSDLCQCEGMGFGMVIGLNLGYKLFNVEPSKFRAELSFPRHIRRIKAVTA